MALAVEARGETLQRGTTFCSASVSGVAVEMSGLPAITARSLGSLGVKVSF